MVERVVDECTKFITHWSPTKKLRGSDKEKLVNVPEQSQPHFTAVIHAHSANNSENFAKIGCVLSEITEQEPVVKTGSSFDR